MRERTVEDIQRTLWGVTDLVRGELSDGVKGAQIVTALFTLKMLSDNNAYFEVLDLLQWSRISSPGGDISKRLHETVVKIEQQLQQISGVFSVVNWMSVDPKHLYRLIQEFDLLDLSYESMEDPDSLNGTLAKVADWWFDQVLRMAGRSSGLEVATPIELSTLCARLLNATQGTVYDGTTGLGGMLIETAREARRTTGKIPDLIGQEINYETWAMARMNFILHGLLEASIAQGDTLMAPRWLVSDHLMRFERIVMQPPFSLKLRDKEAFVHDRFGRFKVVPSAAHADMAFVLHALSSLKEEGKAVLVQTHGVLFRGGADEEIRRVLLEDDLIEAVVALPRNLLSGTGIPVALLILNKKNPHPGHVLFIKADEDFQPGRLQNVLRPTDIEKICDTYFNSNEVDDYSRLVGFDEIAQNDWNLNIARYVDLATVDSRIGKVQISMLSYLDSTTPKVRLADMATSIDRGYGPPKDISGDDVEYTHRFVNLSDVDEEGTIHLETTTPIGGNLRKLKFHELNPGDLIISSRGTAPKSAVVPKTEEKLIASVNFNVIRLRPEFDPWFVKVFLESPVGVQLLLANQRGSAVPVISHKDLVDIVVPSIPLEEQRKIAQTSRRAEEQYLRTIEEAKRLYVEQYHVIYELMCIDQVFKPEERS